MKKHLLYTIITFLIFIKLIAQPIGINTNLPMNDLHINGSIQLTNELNLGGTSKTKGNSGIDGQVLISKGKGRTPEWATINIPVVPKGSYSMTNTFVVIDTTGVKITNGSSKTKYKENESITLVEQNAKWHIFNELTTNIEINDNKNKVNLTLQTISHLSNNGASSKTIFNFAIGVFIDGKLKSVKPFSNTGDSMAFTIVTLISTIEDLPIGKHKLEVAAIPRVKENYKGYLTIGYPNGESTNITNFMAETSLKVDVYELLNK